MFSLIGCRYSACSTVMWYIASNVLQHSNPYTCIPGELEIYRTWDRHAQITNYSGTCVSD